MVDSVSEIKNAQGMLARLKERKRMTEERIEENRLALVALEKTITDTEKGRIIVQNVAAELQKNLEYRITSIVTMALSAVFPDPYEFKMEFVTRRNQTECDMFFVKNGNECDPMDSSGGGAIDIASMALRMATWSIHKTRALQILDEPAKFLSRDMQEKASEILKTLSEDLGIQMIIVSHIPEMITAADKIFQVEQIDGVAKIKTIG